MPTSTPMFKDAIYEHIRFIVSKMCSLPFARADCFILDVGAGDGGYGRALKDLNVEGLEIHQPYIDEYKLHEVYKKVHCCDILKFNYNQYDYIILGDVLEHLAVADAVSLISDISSKKIKCLAAVPYLHPQGASFEWQGKKWTVESEIHLQPDLTPQIMKERYPSLEVFLTNNRLHGGYAYYTNYHKWE